MLPSGLVIKEFDPHQAAEAEFAAFLALTNTIRVEVEPEDPALSLEDLMRVYRWRQPAWVEPHYWLVWQGEKVVAAAGVDIARSESNQHIGYFWIRVLPELRRRGIASELLKLIAEVAQKANRRLLETPTTSAVPASEAFLRRIGAQLGQTMRHSRLEISGVNMAMVRGWLKRAELLENEFQLGLWVGPYPESDLVSVVAMREVMNTQPYGDLNREDDHFTVEQQRAWDASLVERGVERWTMYARHLPTGALAGYTEVHWNRSHSELLEQQSTGVFPQFRNRGIGRWLKAAMIEKVMRERPQVERIRTGNARSNEAMLKINDELGFQAYRTMSIWQVEVNRVLDYLAGGERRDGRPSLTP